MSQHQVIISDDANALIDRKETDQKLSRLKVYIEQANQRLKTLDTQLTTLLDKTTDKELVQKGIDSLIKKHDKDVLEEVSLDGS